MARADNASPVVLVVDDEAFIRWAVSSHLQKCGFLVLEAANAGEATAIFASSIRIDCIFTDIQMPGPMDGLGLARWVHTNHPAVSILVTSGMVQEAVTSLTAGYRVPFISKPYQAEEVEARINALLETHKR